MVVYADVEYTITFDDLHIESEYVFGAYVTNGYSNTNVGDVTEV